MVGIVSKIVGKNLTVKQERLIIGSAILAIVFVYGYFSPQCWFVKTPIGGPAVCNVAGGFAMGGTSGAGNCGNCGTCSTSGDTCTCPTQNCDSCTPPKDHKACGLNGDYTCGGYCPTAYTCEPYSTAGCACVPQGTTPESRDCGVEAGICQGGCPVGYSCTGSPTSGCSCSPSVQYGCTWSGGTTAGLSCGGTCTDGTQCTPFYDGVNSVCGCRGNTGSYVIFPGYDQQNTGTLV